MEINKEKVPSLTSLSKVREGTEQKNLRKQEALFLNTTQKPLKGEVLCSYKSYLEYQFLLKVKKTNTTQK